MPDKGAEPKEIPELLYDLDDRESPSAQGVDRKNRRPKHASAMGTIRLVSRPRLLSKTQGRAQGLRQSYTAVKLRRLGTAPFFGTRMR